MLTIAINKKIEVNIYVDVNLNILKKDSLTL